MLLHHCRKANKIGGQKLKIKSSNLALQNQKEDKQYMKKVIFSVTKAGKNSNRISGIGYITNEDLLIPAISKNGKAYIRVFEDCLKYCHKIPSETDEFRGTYYELKEVEFETKNGSGYETREVEINYYIWYKLAN